jgi:hypothetical protein
MRSLRHLLTVATLAFLMTLAASSAFASDSNRLNLVKTCAGATCVVTTSNVDILAGSTFHYLDGSKLGTSGSPMLLTTRTGIPAGTASGKCQFDSASGTGHCRFSGGTGSLTGFHMNAQVAIVGQGPDFILTGTYHFSGNDH